MKYIEGESILLKLSDEGIAVSTGSACSSKSNKPSHVLEAIGLTSDEGLQGTIRISLSRRNTFKEADYFLNKLKDIVSNLRKISPLH